ncbi:DegT/DnrJ/EryC1/StrS family aminotransferase [Neptunicoccus sediminis]|uniref:DegT/DnrJ/EryC1/StrS family aminotransferase n=1 Tax=Neptunicoccus sediminis TaxID=1892596 RepID=UPI000845C738|nr:DegT/DnrJ/EryC1/StrS family aminotransferase [Neptunicoccus sediminis]
MAGGRPLYVTRPTLPPLQEVIPILEDLWESRILSNGGRYHQEFEAALGDYLGVEHVSLVANATLGLMLALQQCALQGQVITTPFSFIGTSHTLALSGLEPVFADIDPVTLNLDPAAVTAALTPQTSAIMPVHVFGRACDTAAFEALANTHNLRLIYDAAHAFGVRDTGGSVLRHGDMSVLSFHATKVFNTFEGGAVISRDAATKEGIDELRNFGIVDEVTVSRVGMNAKMNEFSAGLGLLQLKYIDDATERRGQADARYRDLLAQVPEVRCLPLASGQTGNKYSFPILVQPDAGFTRDALYERLRANGIYARRYFYPLISDMPMYRHQPSAQPENLPVARDIAQRILCLPLSPDLGAEEQQRIVKVIAETKTGLS